MFLRMDRKLSGIELICFDLFGTLIEIREPRWPHLKLLRAVQGKDKRPHHRILLTRAIPLERVPSAFDTPVASEASRRRRRLSLMSWHRSVCVTASVPCWRAFLCPTPCAAI